MAWRRRPDDHPSSIPHAGTASQRTGQSNQDLGLSDQDGHGLHTWNGRDDPRDHALDRFPVDPRALTPVLTTAVSKATCNDLPSTSGRIRSSDLTDEALQFRLAVTSKKRRNVSEAVLGYSRR